MLYPFVFKPLLKEVIWGGSAIGPFKGITPVQEGIGESWEISHVEGNYSVVANGPLAGQTIDDLMTQFGPLLAGKKVIRRFGNTFPLLIKFIDARENLSIQVHPDDELAMKRHHSFGKTEMWYVINAAPGSVLYSGFSQQIDPAEYVRRVEEDTIMDVLQKYQVKEGDVFFLPAGRVHAIGAGCFIAEIQQTSNITYRIYDYNRKNADGKGRELHTGLARDAIDYTVCPDYRTGYRAEKNEAVRLVTCPYFTTQLLEIDRPLLRDHTHKDSFVVYICMVGEAVLRDDKGNDLQVRQGQTVLVPADTKTVELIPSAGSRFMETYID